MAHVPAMVEEVLKYLDPKPNQNFVDCTLGDGGHALAILERTAPNGKLLGIDADAEAIENVEFRMKNAELLRRLVAVQGNFRNLAAIVSAQNFPAGPTAGVLRTEQENLGGLRAKATAEARLDLSSAEGNLGGVHGVLLDLGFSSSTLERGRGFSFEKDELLDMRFDTSHGIRAAEIVNGWNQQQLAKLLDEYGEEKLAREIANRIVAERKKKTIVTTRQLVEVIIMAYREKLRSNKEIPWIGGIHPATRTFQALRIAVNDELNALQEVLPQAVAILEPGGRLAVLAFHSLEDRIVKQFFRQHTDVKIKVLTKKPAVPSDTEIKSNPRARSAKLRVVER